MGPPIRFTLRCLAGVLLTYGSGHPRGAAETGFGPAFSTPGGLLPAVAGGDVTAATTFSLRDPFQSLGGNAGGGLR